MWRAVRWCRGRGGRSATNYVRDQMRFQVGPWSDSMQFASAALLAVAAGLATPPRCRPPAQAGPPVLSVGTGPA